MNPTDYQDAVTITGAGMVTCLGLDVDQTWRRVMDGDCGIGPSTAMQSTPSPDKGYGQAPERDDSDPSQPREVRSLRRAIDEAIAQAGLVDAEGRWRVAPDRCGLVMGTTLHGMPAAGRYCRSNDSSDLDSFLGGSTLAMALRGLPITGASLTTCAACASGLVSMGIAMSMLRSGELDVVLAGGYDPVSEYAYGGFNSLRLITESAQQPFAKSRAGLKLAEGYGVVVLERGADVAARGQRGLARLLSCASTSDAHHLSQPHPEGAGASRAIRQALYEAGVADADVAMIVAHATATPDNDRAEAAAYASVFGDALPSVPVTAIKSHLGHTLGAAGAVELILSIRALQQGLVPALTNVSKEDVEFDNIQVVTGEPRPITGRHAVVTSLGFGGSNACAVVQANASTAEPSREDAGQCLNAPATPRTQPARFTPVITGIGVVTPDAIGADAFAIWLDSAQASRGEKPDAKLLNEHINTRRARRMSEYVKLLLAATSLACRHAGVEDASAYPGTLGAVTGSMHGSAKFSEDYYRQIVEEGVDFANPLLFAEGVPNAGSAHLSMMLRLTGPCLTMIGGRTAGLDSLGLAATRIATGEWDAAVVGAAEEHCDLIPEIYRQCGLHATGEAAPPFADEPAGFVSSAAGVVLFVESLESAQRRGATVYGSVEAWDRAAWNSRAIKPGITNIAAMLGRNRFAEHVISSANGTHLDRMEAIALRIASSHLSLDPAVSALGPTLREMFSVGPLLAIAATLLRRRALGTVGGGLDGIGGMRPAQRDEPVNRFAVLSTDYNGACATAWLSVADPSNPPGGS